MEKVGSALKRTLSQNKLKTSSSSNLAVGYEYTSENKKAIASTLGACLMVQRTYGKQGGDLQIMVNIFCKTLSDLPPEGVMRALEKWLGSSQEFPTPADIRAIVKPEPKYDYAVYNRLVSKTKSDPMSLSSEDWKYIKKYEQNAKKGL